MRHCILCGRQLGTHRHSAGLGLLIFALALGLTLFPSSSQALEDASQQKEGVVCPKGTPCENIDCSAQDTNLPLQQGSIQGVCTIYRGRTLVLKAPPSMMFIGKSAVGSDSICEVVSPYTVKHRKRSADAERFTESGWVGIRGKEAGKTTVTLWFKKAGEPLSDKELFSVTYNVKVEVPQSGIRCIGQIRE